MCFGVDLWGVDNCTLSALHLSKHKSIWDEELTFALLQTESEDHDSDFFLSSRDSKVATLPQSDAFGEEIPCMSLQNMAEGSCCETDKTHQKET